MVNSLTVNNWTLRKCSLHLIPYKFPPISALPSRSPSKKPTISSGSQPSQYSKNMSYLYLHLTANKQKIDTLLIQVWHHFVHFPEQLVCPPDILINSWNLSDPAPNPSGKWNIIEVFYTLFKVLLLNSLPTLDLHT